MSVARQETNKLTYLERYFEIHGELEDFVYRTKRNGELVIFYPMQAKTFEPYSGQEFWATELE